MTESKSFYLNRLAETLAERENRGVIPDRVWNEAESLYQSALTGETQADEKRLREILEAIRAENEEPDESGMPEAYWGSADHALNVIQNLASRHGTQADEVDAYKARVAELEAEGMSTSDAQGIADLEFEPVRKPRK